MNSRKNQPSSAQPEAVLDMGRVQRHQSFAQTIADKYKFVRRDDRGRLSLTFREMGAAASALPPASITTVVQQVQVKLGLLMPLQVRLESLERKWLVQVERWLRGTDRSFDRVVMRVGQKLREDERREPGAAGNQLAPRAEMNARSSRQAAPGIPSTNYADGSRPLSNPMSSGERGRASDTPFTYAALRGRQEGADGTRSTKSGQEAQEERLRVERVEDVLERTRVEWRRALRLAAIAALPAGDRHVDAESVRRRSDRQEVSRHEANLDRLQSVRRQGSEASGNVDHPASPGAHYAREIASGIRVTNVTKSNASSRETQSHATVVLHRYLRMLDASSPFAPDGSMMPRRPGVHRHEPLSQNDASNTSGETGEAQLRRARIDLTPRYRDFSTDVRNRVSRSTQSPIREHGVHNGTAGHITSASGHSAWSAQLVHAVLGRLTGEGSVTIRPFLNRSMGMPRMAGENGGAGREAVQRQHNAAANAPRNRSVSAALKPEHVGENRRTALASRDAKSSEQDSRNDARQGQAAPPGMASQVQSVVDSTLSVRTTPLGGASGMRSDAAPNVTSAPMQLRLVRRGNPELGSRDRRTNVSAVEHHDLRSRNAAPHETTHQSGTTPSTKQTAVDKQALASEGLLIHDDIAHQAAKSDKTGSRQTVPVLQRTVPNGLSDKSSDPRIEGRIQAIRRRETASRLSVSRWQLVEITSAMIDGQADQQANNAYKPVRSPLLVQRSRISGDPGSRTPAEPGATSDRGTHQAANGGIRFYVKPTQSTGSSERERSERHTVGEPAARSWVTTASVPQIQRFKHRLRPRKSTTEDTNEMISHVPIISKPLLKGLSSLLQKSSPALTDRAPDNSAARDFINGTGDIAKRLPRANRTSDDDLSAHPSERPSALTSVNGSKLDISALPPHSSVRLVLARRQIGAADSVSAVERAASPSAENVGSAAKRMIAQKAAAATTYAAIAPVAPFRRTPSQASSDITAQNPAVQADQEASIAVRARLNVRRIQQHLPLLSALISEGTLIRSGFAKEGQRFGLVHFLARRMQLDEANTRRDQETAPRQDLPLQTVRIHLRRSRLNPQDMAEMALKTASRTQAQAEADVTVSARGSVQGAERAGNLTGQHRASIAKGTLSTANRQEKETGKQTTDLARLALPASLSFVFAAAARSAARLRTGSTAGRFAGWNEGVPLLARQGAKPHGRTPAGQAISPIVPPVQANRDQPQQQRAAARSALNVNAIHRIFRQYGPSAAAMQGDSVQANTAPSEAASTLITQRSRAGTVGKQTEDSRKGSRERAATPNNSRTAVLHYRMQTAAPILSSRGSTSIGGLILNTLTHRAVELIESVQHARSLNAGIASNFANSDFADARTASANLTVAVQRRNIGYANAGKLDRTSGVPSVNAQDVAEATGQAAEHQMTTSSPVMHYSAARPQAAAAPSRSAIQPAMMQHAAKTQAAAAPPAQPVKPIEPTRAPAIDPAQLQQMLNQLPQLQPDVIAGKVMTAIEKKMKFQQRTRGY
ncbi:hypothetical protein [Paenibacillus xanthanilyticus]|uniref:Uncharacterized protein n=1 Tax=Paenibacillus xanthanilyticus TaxID=1783531 RepID=A0ABV8K7F0_9BACL